MDTRIYNIDSKFRNTTNYPNSSNFVFNKMDGLNAEGTSYIVEPFNEKNVIELKISSLELPNTIYYIQSTKGNNVLELNGVDVIVPDGSYTKAELTAYLQANMAGVNISISSTTNKVTIINNGAGDITFPVSGTNYLSLGEILGFLSTDIIPNDISTNIATNVMVDPQIKYFFLKVNDYGNIINKNRRYVSKIVTDAQSRFDDINQETFIKIIGNNIKFEQPLDIPKLQISLEDEFGNLVSLNGSNWSFTLEVVIITNTILKNYNEIRFYSEEVMDRILKAKMLAYYQKQVEPIDNNTLTNKYNNNLVNLNNYQEYSSSGSKNNYAPNYSFFKQQ
jgi:hypothetical protein